MTLIKYFNFKFVSTCLLVIFLALVLPSAISAQTTTNSPSSKAKISPTPAPLQVPDQAPTAGVNLTISPPFLNLTTDPGVPVSSQVKILNNNNFREYLHFEIAKFDASTSGDRPVLQSVTDQDEFAKWVSFSEPVFAVDPNEQKTVKFTISPPKDAQLSYYYALMVERVKLGTASGSQTIVSGAPAFLIILEVRSPNAKRDLQLVDFSTDSPVYEYLPATFNIKLKNDGNVHAIPYGDIFIDSLTQKEIDSIKANPTKGNILPNTTRTYQSSWSNGFITRTPKIENNVTQRDKNGNIIYETKWDFAKLADFRIGYYTAHLIAVYDNGQRDVPLEATTSFWIIPWKIIGVGLAILLFILLGVKSMLSAVFGRFNSRR